MKNIKKYVDWESPTVLAPLQFKILPLDGATTSEIQSNTLLLISQ